MAIFQLAATDMPTYLRLRHAASLVDPNKVMLRGRPKTVEDIFVAAANNWLVSYENLSGLTAEQQDAFCTLATGGGFASRQLYTNGEEHVRLFKFWWCAVYNRTIRYWGQ